MKQQTIDLITKAVPWVISLLSLLTTIILANNISFKKKIKEKQLDTLVDFLREYSETFVEVEWLGEFGWKSESHLVVALGAKRFPFAYSVAFPPKPELYFGPSLIQTLPFLKYKNNTFLPRNIYRVLHQIDNLEYRYSYRKGFKSKLGPSGSFVIMYPSTKKGMNTLFDDNVWQSSSENIEPLLKLIKQLNKEIDRWLKKHGGKELAGYSF